jgi:hypothetical protein
VLGANATAEAGIVVSAFPNPTSGNLTLDFGYRESGFVSTAPTIVTVSDMMGNIVLRTERQANSTGEFTMDLSNNRNGMYFVSVRTGNSAINKKIYLQR